MARKTPKKRNKHYNPKPVMQHIGGNILLPHHAAQLATLSRPLRDDEIEKICLPLHVFIQALKDGTATHNQFQHMMDTGYCMVYLLLILLQQPQLSSDSEYDQKCRDEFRKVLHETDDKMSDMIESIGFRQKRTGKYGASAQDLETLQWIANNFEIILSFIDFKHYYEALRQSQAKISQIRAINNRRIQKEFHL